MPASGHNRSKYTEGSLRRVCGDVPLTSNGARHPDHIRLRSRGAQRSERFPGVVCPEGTMQTVRVVPGYQDDIARSALTMCRNRELSRVNKGPRRLKEAVTREISLRISERQSGRAEHRKSRGNDRHFRRNLGDPSGPEVGTFMRSGVSDFETKSASRSEAQLARR